jgi:hypothetical protein
MRTKGGRGAMKLHFEIELNGEQYDADWLCPANLVYLLTTDNYILKDILKRVKNTDDGYWSDAYMQIGRDKKEGDER